MSERKAKVPVPVSPIDRAKEWLRVEAAGHQRAVENWQKSVDDTARDSYRHTANQAGLASARARLENCVLAMRGLDLLAALPTPPDEEAR